MATDKAAHIYRIWPGIDAPLDADVELDDMAVILHSRGGATGGRPPRNTDYQAALVFIIERLYRDHQWIRRVLIDSRHAHAIAPDEDARVLMEQVEVEAIANPQEIIRIIRQRARDFGQPAGTTGGNSTKQLRIETGWGHAFLRAGLNLRIYKGTADAGARTETRRRLSNDQQRLVSSGDIHAAVESLLSGNDADAFADSRDYDLVTPAGQRLAPKKVFGRALEFAGVVPEARPFHFSAGWSQPCFELLQAAGYDILEKSESAAEASRRQRRASRSKAEIEKAAATVPTDPEELSWIEGNPRMARHLRTERTRSANAAAAKRAAVRAANDGRLACEDCKTDWYTVYPTGIAEAIFDVHHTIPVKDMAEDHETTIADLRLLCANCHRAEHRRMALD